MLVLVGLISRSYGRALTYPGSASWSVRTVDWLRENGGGTPINALEVWYYSRHAPPTHGNPSTGQLPPPPTPAQSLEVTQAGRASRSPSPIPLVGPARPGEGRWVPGPDAGGHPASYTSWFRPDPKHPTLVAGVLWLDQRHVRFDLVAGTKEPGGGPWPGSAQIPAAQRSRTVAAFNAAFNAGFLAVDSGGGFYEAGRSHGALRPGVASLVIDRSGAIQIGTWGQQVHRTADTYAVRQNLHLVVDHGAPVRGLVTNAKKRWGSRSSQLQYTWRSGIGIDGHGHVVFVAGDHFTLTTLADALARAGATEAMQLDIHPDQVTANLYDLGRLDPRKAPVKLLPNMVRPASRYLTPDQRDFITARLR